MSSWVNYSLDPSVLDFSPIMSPDLGGMHLLSSKDLIENSHYDSMEPLRALVVRYYADHTIIFR